MSTQAELFDRRAVLRNIVLPALAGSSTPCSAAVLEPAVVRPLDQEPVVDPSKFVKVNGGARFADLKIGSGPEAVLGSKVSLQWILRRSNGYFVDSSLGTLASGPQGGFLNVGRSASEKDIFGEQQNPFIFVVGDGTALSGIDACVRGMKQGGVRRLILPVKTDSAYTLPLDKSGGPVPSDFGPRRQIERELSKQDPYNYFFFEIQLERVRP